MSRPVAAVTVTPIKHGSGMRTPIVVICEDGSVFVHGGIEGGRWTAMASIPNTPATGETKPLL